jgi:hypothetical protein
MVFGALDAVFVDETRGALGELLFWLATEFWVEGATITGACGLELKKKYRATATSTKTAATLKPFFI